MVTSLPAKCLLPAAEDINMFNIVQHCYIIGYADKEVSITAEDTTHANVILYLICRFVPFEIQSVEGKKMYNLNKFNLYILYTGSVVPLAMSFYIFRKTSR